MDNSDLKVPVRILFKRSGKTQLPRNMINSHLPRKHSQLLRMNHSICLVFLLFAGMAVDVLGRARVLRPGTRPAVFEGDVGGLALGGNGVFELFGKDDHSIGYFIKEDISIVGEYPIFSAPSTNRYWMLGSLAFSNAIMGVRSYGGLGWQDTIFEPNSSLDPVATVDVSAGVIAKIHSDRSGHTLVESESPSAFTVTQADSKYDGGVSWDVSGSSLEIETLKFSCRTGPGKWGIIAEEKAVAPETRDKIELTWFDNGESSTSTFEHRAEYSTMHEGRILIPNKEGYNWVSFTPVGTRNDVAPADRHSLLAIGGDDGNLKFAFKIPDYWPVSLSNWFFGGGFDTYRTAPIPTEDSDFSFIIGNSADRSQDGFVARVNHESGEFTAYAINAPGDGFTDIIDFKLVECSLANCDSLVISMNQSRTVFTIDWPRSGTPQVVNSFRETGSESGDGIYLMDSRDNFFLPRTGSGVFEYTWLELPDTEGEAGDVGIQLDVPITLTPLDLGATSIMSEFGTFAEDVVVSERPAGSELPFVKVAGGSFTLTEGIVTIVEVAVSDPQVFPDLEIQSANRDVDPAVILSWFPIAGRDTILQRSDEGDIWTDVESFEDADPGIEIVREQSISGKSRGMWRLKAKPDE